MNEQAVKAVPGLWLPDNLFYLIKVCISLREMVKKASAPWVRLFTSPGGSPGDDYLCVRRSLHKSVAAGWWEACV